MKKYRMFFRFEKEEAWLNELTAKGWCFMGRTFWGNYIFEKDEPNPSVNIRIDFRQFNKTDDFREYIQLFSDNGWSHIYGTKYSGWQYFAPVKADAPEDIFSDNASKAGRYHRLCAFWLSLFVVYTSLFVANIINNADDPTTIFRPKELYFTPGLWDLTGSSFWRAFLFETPFALGRGFAGLFEIVVLGLCLYFVVRSYIEGKKTKLERG